MDAPHPERCPGAKTAHGQAQVLGKIIAVLEVQSRDGGQGFIQLQLWLASGDVGWLYHTQGGGGVVETAAQSGGGDVDRDGRCPGFVFFVLRRYLPCCGQQPGRQP